MSIFIAIFIFLLEWLKFKVNNDMARVDKKVFSLVLF